jgi:hypothetical protein
MSMNNEELSLKFAVMENQLTTLVASNQRIEAAMGMIASLDKSIAEIKSDHKHFTTKIAEVERDTAICAADRDRQHDKILVELNNVKTDTNHAKSVAKTAIWFLSGLGSIATGFFIYLFNTADMNKDVNTRQTQEIQDLQNWRKQ